MAVWEMVGAIHMAKVCDLSSCEGHVLLILAEAANLSTRTCFLGIGHADHCVRELGPIPC